MSTLGRVTRSGRVRRIQKFVRQQVTDRSDAPRRAVFILGCQRSGTTMTLQALDRSPDIWVWEEARRSPAFVNERLRPSEVIARLVQRHKVRASVFKPVCDSHLADQLLDRHPGSRVLWVYRDPRAVARSAVKRWGDHQKGFMGRIARGQTNDLGWRAERLDVEAIEVIRRHYRDDMSDEEGALLFWLVRNRFFFRLELENHPRVKLVRYASLLADPERGFREILDFIDCPFDPSVLDGLRVASKAEDEPPTSELTDACRTLLARLDDCRDRQAHLVDG